MIGPITAEAAVSAAAKLGVYLPSCVIMFCIILPEPAASAMAEPDMPAKMMLWTTLTWARPPRKRPTSALQKRSSRSVMLPEFMISAERMKSGTASSDVARVHAVEQLLGGRAHVEPGEAAGRGSSRAIIAWPIGRPRRLSDDDRDDRERERAGELHTPELALVGSNASGALPRSAPPDEPDVADDHRDGEDGRRSR